MQQKPKRMGKKEQDKEHLIKIGEDLAKRKNCDFPVFIILPVGLRRSGQKKVMNAFRAYLTELGGWNQHYVDMNDFAKMIVS